MPDLSKNLRHIDLLTLKNNITYKSERLFYVKTSLADFQVKRFLKKLYGSLENLKESGSAAKDIFT